MSRGKAGVTPFLRVYVRNSGKVVLQVVRSILGQRDDLPSQEKP